MNARKKYMAISSFLLALSIGLGAFGAHIITPGLDEKYIRTLDTANHYLFVHSVALLVLASIMDSLNSTVIRKIYIGIVLAVILFSGSLYFIVLSNYFSFGVPWYIGILTPIGGTVFIISWVSLGLYFLRS